MSEKSALESEVKELARKTETLGPTRRWECHLNCYMATIEYRYCVGTIPKDVEPIVSPITTDYELFSAPYGTGRIFALYVLKDHSAAVSEALAKNDFIELEPLPGTGDPAVL